MDNNSDLQSAEKRRDSQTVFKFIQSQMLNTQKDLRAVQEVAAGPRFRSVSRAGSAFTNSIAEQTLISEVMQGGALQATNIIEFEIVGTALNNSGVADNVTYRVKYGGTTLTLGPASLTSNAQRRMFRIIGWLYGVNSPIVQNLVAKLEITDVAGSFGAGLVNTYRETALAIDSSIDQTFAFSIQHGTAQMQIGSTLLLYKLGAPITAA